MKLVFAHKYKWSHEKRRKILRRALKDKLVELVEKTDEGFLYKVPDDFNFSKIRIR